MTVLKEVGNLLDEIGRMTFSVTDHAHHVKLWVLR